jgi:hypothetical protein
MEAAKAKGLPLIDQHPRPGLAGMIWLFRCAVSPKFHVGFRGMLHEIA